MCEKCNMEILVDLGRQVHNCRHGGEWCSCKVREYLRLLGIMEIDDDGEEVRWATEWFPKVEHEEG